MDAFLWNVLWNVGVRFVNVRFRKTWTFSQRHSIAPKHMDDMDVTKSYVYHSAVDLERGRTSWRSPCRHNPHLVKKNGSNITCDSLCEGFVTFKLCAHTLAVGGCLENR